MDEHHNIAIVGAGLVGCTQALFMAKLGHTVSVYERRSNPKTSQIEAGRSINLALSTRGISALEELGLAEKVKAIATPMYGRYIHTEHGTDFQPYGANNECIYSISRANFNLLLIDECESNSKIELFFDKKCLGVDTLKNSLQFEGDSESEQQKKCFDKIYGADGAYSILRQELMKNERFNFSQNYLQHGYKELTIPAINGKHALENDGLHIWPRGTFMLIALPNLDGSFTCTLFMPFEGNTSFKALNTTQDVRQFFNAVFPTASEIMPDLENEFLKNPTSVLVSIKCAPWGYKNQILLLGDASHAIVPFYGQGMNSGLEDCHLLYKQFMKPGKTPKKLFATFAKNRKIDTDAILQLSLNNYVEMRDSTANPQFLLRKKIERLMSKKHPKIWTPLYSQVTFSNIPYSVALQNGQKQSEIMDNIMMKKDIELVWDSEEIENEIVDRMLLSV